MSDEGFKPGDDECRPNQDKSDVISLNTPLQISLNKDWKKIQSGITATSMSSHNNDHDELKNFTSSSNNGHEVKNFSNNGSERKDEEKNENSSNQEDVKEKVKSGPKSLMDIQFSAPKKLEGLLSNLKEASERHRDQSPSGGWQDNHRGGFDAGPRGFGGPRGFRGGPPDQGFRGRPGRGNQGPRFGGPSNRGFGGMEGPSNRGSRFGDHSGPGPVKRSRFGEMEEPDDYAEPAFGADSGGFGTRRGFGGPRSQQDDEDNSSRDRKTSSDSGNFKSRSDYSGTGANSEPFVPRKPGSGKFKAMAAEVTIDLSFLQRSNDKSEPSKPVQAEDPPSRLRGNNDPSSSGFGEKTNPPSQGPDFEEKSDSAPSGPRFGDRSGPPPSGPRFGERGGPPQSGPRFGGRGGPFPSGPRFGERGGPSPSGPRFGERGGPPPSGPRFGQRGPPGQSGPPFGARGGPHPPGPRFGERGGFQSFGPPRFGGRNGPPPGPRFGSGPPGPRGPGFGGMDPSIYARVEEAVTPLCKMPIVAQLQKKDGLARSVMDGMRQEITDANPAANTWFLYQENKFQCILDLRKIVPSPVVDGYRNKCEFVIGLNPADNHQLTIGFLIERGTSLVGPINHLKHVPDQMKFIASELQNCLRDSQIPPFDLVSGTGHWMGLTIRISISGEALLLISFHPQNMNKFQLKDIKSKLRGFFTDGPGVQCHVTSLYFNERQQWESGELEHIYGSECITETLMGKMFQISPKCFFAVNTRAAEKLHSTIAELVHLNRSCTLLDICCGTGAIGLSLADQCGQVVGLDILENAIEDARQNALVNNITNCEYFPGSAEEHLGNLFRRIAFTEVICVLDPPRGGLGAKAINQIRKNEAITKVVFISSDPFSAMKCFADLSRSPSNTFKGEPFIPVRAVPVDTFPHTNNFSLVILFLRVKMTDLVNPQNVNPDSYKAGCAPGGTSMYPEPVAYGQGTPGPDLSWKTVTPQAQATITPDGSAPSEELLGLSKDQVSWLNQMTQMYGSQFERDKWIETFRHQNMEASYAAVTAARVAPTAPTAAQGDSSAAWAEYSKQYREYKEWWEKHGSSYPGAYPQPAATAPYPQPGAFGSYPQPGSAPSYPPPGSAAGYPQPGAAAGYPQTPYYPGWNGPVAPPLPKTPAPK